MLLSIGTVDLVKPVNSKVFYRALSHRVLPFIFKATLKAMKIEEKQQDGQYGQSHQHRNRAAVT